jgi:hypothetical protein
MHRNNSSFWVPKRGNSIDEYEDAYAIDTVETESNIVRIAVADGASEGFFSKIWADILVKNFHRKKITTMSAFLEHCNEDWKIWKSQYLEGRQASDRPIQWFEEDGIRRGAYSTFLGLNIKRDDSQWQAIAIGDTCLFHIRNGALIQSFPLCDSISFNNSPILLSSENPLTNEIMDAIVLETGSYREGDCFFLMTDALSAWVLQEFENGNDPIDEILGINTQDEFAAFIDTLRTENHLHNDDVTLVTMWMDE